MNLDPDGRVAEARFIASPNCDARPPQVSVTLLLLHSISLPPGQYGGDAVERLFTNRLDPQTHPYFSEIAGLRVSAHFFVRRNGELVQFVPAQLRAWHAGNSAWRGCERCNDYSIGVELEGTDDSDFDDPQYVTLVALARGLRKAFPLRDIAAHSDVAAGRKTDPGARFDWTRFLRDLSCA
jgi:N-acetyl-anhydromuramoyl-L-alanine amidase